MVVDIRASDIYRERITATRRRRRIHAAVERVNGLVFCSTRVKERNDRVRSAAVEEWMRLGSEDGVLGGG